jgi:hypothetical protein
MALRVVNKEICETVPEMLHRLLKFSLAFAKRINDKKPLLNGELPVNFIGIQHLIMLL